MALCSLEIGPAGFDEFEIHGAPERAAVTRAIAARSPERLLLIAQAMRRRLSNGEIRESTDFDPWFLERISEVAECEASIRISGIPDSSEEMRWLKMSGFSDARPGALSGLSEEELRKRRTALGVVAAYKRIDTCAAEFDAQNSYMYSTNETPAMGEAECESNLFERTKIVVLGGEPNRIGQGIELDCHCCHACFALSDAGFETIMVNCNPEAVSTDCDTSDRPQFEPLTLEHVPEALRAESANGILRGVVVQLGGQTPLKSANALQRAHIPILGTSPD